MMRLEEYDDLHHFSAEEFNEPEKMDREFLRKLDKARSIAGVSFKITSSQRTDDTPDEIDSTHEIGLAVDISCPEKGHCRERHQIITSLHAVGITRIGIYDRHIHGDEGERHDPSKYPPNCIWWGVSK